MEDRSVLSRDARLPDLALSDADVYFGDPARPVIVLIHGGFWRPEYDRLHLRPLAAALADEGWPVYSIEYRRIPGRPDLLVADVRAALETVSGDAILMGHSAGGHLALWAAAFFKARGVIGLAPVADLELARSLDLDDGAVAAFLGDHDQNQYQPGVPAATLIHGTEDTLVPLSLSRAYADRHPECRLVELPGAGHFAVIDPLSDAWPIVIEELRRLLA